MDDDTVVLTDDGPVVRTNNSPVVRADDGTIVHADDGAVVRTDVGTVVSIANCAGNVTGLCGIRTVTVNGGSTNKYKPELQLEWSLG